MRTNCVLAAALLCMATASSLAATYPPGVDPETGARPGNVIGTGNSLPLSDKASNINAYDTHSSIAPRLPAPMVTGDDPEQYLRAANEALAAGHTGQAQEALEESEARLLDRSVPMGQTNVPDQGPAIRHIHEALQALAAGDLAQAERLTDRAAKAIASRRGTPDQAEISRGLTCR